MISKKPQLIITGATGFIGSHLSNRLSQEGWPVRCTVRRSGIREGMVVGDLAPDTSWLHALKGIDVVVHLAARVHVMNESANDPITEFRKVNVEGTLNLARQAAAAGIKRFIFISSIKVNGELTMPGKPYAADDQPAPVGPYGISKWEAEVGLLKLAQETGMDVVIIRPPLVYGPGVKANFQTMMQWIRRGVPIPLGAIHNKRSLVALDNLVDLIVTCIDHPAAANQIFLAGDGEDLSTTELLQRMAMALGRPLRLMPVPVWLLEAGAVLIGQQALAQRLCRSLQVDITKARDLLGWVPPVSMDEAMQKTANHFLESQQ